MLRNCDKQKRKNFERRTLEEIRDESPPHYPDWVPLRDLYMQYSKHYTGGGVLSRLEDDDLITLKWMHNGRTHAWHVKLTGKAWEQLVGNSPKYSSEDVS